MQTLALRLYGKNDLRLESFELPEIQPDEILAELTTNSVCMSTHKAAEQGADHKRVPNDVATNPVIVGHEFAGTILEVGAAHRDRFSPGQRFSIQPALSYPGREYDAPGYTFPYCGGHATHIIIPREVMEMNCLLPYDGEGFFQASLSEPLSCIIGAFKTNYHTRPGQYDHAPGIVEGGAMAILAGAGPMGLGAIDYALHGPRQPRLLVVTDIDQGRLDRAARILTPEEAKKCGVDLRYVNTASGNPVEDLRALTDGKGFDDVFVFAPVAAVIEQGDRILGQDGCLNFFAGPTRKDFTAPLNFYEVHYGGHHVVGSSGGNTQDMIDALELMGQGRLSPEVLITHVGGINCAAETILNLPNIPGGKKLVYTHKDMPLTAIDDFEEKGKTDPFYAELATITARNNGLWSVEAERYVLEHAPNIAVPVS